MQFSAIHTLTVLDYPGKVAAILFTPGCNFRCHYCHNAEFVLPEKIRELQHDFIPEEKVLNFLKTRQGKLDGIVVSGGEPTIHGENLLRFFRKVKALGFLIKIDTNGTNPNFLETALSDNLIDYVAMDVKAPPEEYAEIVGVNIPGDWLQKSRDILQNSGIDYELRTTIIKGVHTHEMLQKIFEFCAGAPRYTLQNYRAEKVLNPAWKKYTGFSQDELLQIQKNAKQVIENVLVLENL